MRQTRPGREPTGYRFVRFVNGTPPFSQQEEEELFRALGVSALVCRDFGGEAGMSKLAAARQLGLAVLMIDQPPLPEGVALSGSIEAALAWRARL